MKAVDPTMRVAVCSLGRPDPEWNSRMRGRTRSLDKLGMTSYSDVFEFKDVWLWQGKTC